MTFFIIDARASKYIPYSVSSSCEYTSVLGLKGPTLVHENGDVCGPEDVIRFG